MMLHNKYIIALNNNTVQLNTHLNKKALYILRAINHPLRLSIIELLDKEKKVTVTTIYTLLNIQQAVASQHLAILRKAGFVNTKKESKFVYYTLSINYINHFSKTIELLENGK